MADAAPLDPNLEPMWRAFLGHFMDAAANRIRTDQDLGSASRSVDARLAPSALIHLVESMITRELATATPPTREQVVDLLTHTMLGLVYPAPAGEPKAQPRWVMVWPGE